MSEIIDVIETKCVFCGVSIKWDRSLATCPECDGTCDDPVTGALCPICGGDGFVDSDDYLPCCGICFYREYNEEELEELNKVTN